MKYCLFCFYMFSTAAAAQPISPARYVDAQGVEVIHNRGAEPAAGGQVTTPAVAPAIKPRGADPKLQVSAAEQQGRDRDRIAILQQELAAEVKALEAGFLRAKQAKPDQLSAAESQRLTEDMDAHQKNILALHGELRRAGQPR